MISGHKIFHGYATHGVPLSIGLMVLEGKQINFREYIDAARENGWTDRRINAALTEGLRDSGWPNADEILGRSRSYMVKYG